MQAKFKFLLCVSLCVLSTAMASVTEEEASRMFADYVAKFNKSYSGLEELEHRFKNFRLTLEALEKLGDDSTYGFNEFSDMSPAEFKATHLGYGRKDRNVTADAAPRVKAFADRSVSSVTSTGQSVDWRLHGAVTAVKNQGQCGSCWAFSATEEIESMYFMKYKRTVTLSPQQIVSCNTEQGGCQGGFPWDAYRYVHNAGGMMSNSSYPYTDGRCFDNHPSNANCYGQCLFDKNQVKVQVGFGPNGRTHEWAVPNPCQYGCPGTNQDTAALNDNLNAWGPLSICVAAESWQYINNGFNGVLSSTAKCSPSSQNTDHCVQLVGSNFDAPVPYWIVRNSWGSNWAANGYVYVAVEGNPCGVANQPTRTFVV